MIREEIIEAIKEIIKGLIAQMGVSADIEIREQPGTVVFNVRTPESHMLIGQYGVNLAALQYLARVLARRKLAEDVDFVIDVDDYKKKRENHLSALADAVSKQVADTGKATVLRPMPAYERRIIHAVLSGNNDVVSGSVGEEPNRMVTIRPKNTPEVALPPNFEFGDEEYKQID